MKKFTIAAIVLLFFYTPLSIAQNFKTAWDYLEFVSKEQKVITKNTWQYTKAIAHSKSDRAITGKKSTLIKSIDRAILKIEKANSFEEDTFKEDVLQNLRLNKTLLEEDYEKIIDMKEVAEQSYDAMEAYILARELADKKMNEAQQEFELKFHAFADKHNITIVDEETDLSKKMAISGEVFKHYNEMYLVFFKVFINEVYLYDAMEKNDVGAIRQNSNALSESAREGLEKLNAIELYKKDRILLDATEKAFGFFMDETETKIPQVVDFLVLNADFEAIKQSLDKTPEKKRTESQINTYNDKVNAVNKAVDSYNKMNASLNKQRQNVLNALDLANEKFLSKHIPND